MKNKERNQELREASGAVTFSDPLTSFLYTLMRDELAAGTVERLVRDAVDGDEVTVFTNGWLANYANNLAGRLQNANSIRLQRALDQAFEETQAAKAKKAEEESKETGELDPRAKPHEELGDDELSRLERQLVEMTRNGQSLDDPAVDDVDSAADEAKKAVEELVSQGHLTAEQAQDLKSDIDSATEEVPEEATEEVEPEEKEEEPKAVFRRAEDTEENEKWKKTTEELQKLEEEETKTEEE